MTDGYTNENSNTNLETLKDEISKMIDEKLDAFVDDFLEAMSEANNTEEECSCDQCKEFETCEEDGPRYLIVSGGREYPASDIKPNAFAGIDFYLRQKDTKTGREYNSQGTITSSDVVIIDLQPEMDLETFSAIKKSTIDYVVSQAQEAKAKEDATKKANSGSPPKDLNVTYMSYT